MPSSLQTSGFVTKEATAQTIKRALSLEISGHIMVATREERTPPPNDQV
jgi:hypothetical protein